VSPAREARRSAQDPSAGPDLRLWTWALHGLHERPDDTVGIEVHLPFCLRHCLYCGHEVEAGSDEGTMGRYAQALRHEMALVAGHLGHACDVVQVHFGGGTPNHLPDDTLADLVLALRQRFRTLAETEWSIDCDPRRATDAQMQMLRRLGFTHLRLGLPDLDPEVQAAAGRVQSLALMHDVMAMARRARLPSVQLDLVCGLPLQDLARWRRTLHQVLALGPDRVQCLHYLHQPSRFWNQCAIGREQLPDIAEQQAMWALAADTLTQAGYRWIGGDLYVLDDDPLARAADAGQLHASALGYGALPVHHLLAFGAGRTSDVADTLARSETRRTAWAGALDHGHWPLAATRRRSAEQRERRRAMRQLQCNLRLSESQAGPHLQQAFQRLGATAAQGWVERDGTALCVTHAGRLQLDRLCALLDEHDTPPGHLAPVRWLQ
jgi:oxygen-independent coproporphyrinogen-3 oxidase